ncbi:GNAT family N-acetyltransferase [Photobacterium sp. WH77]|uniref:GNAT family N-acetyltransferase n=1 Tax=Photobacterium TaxID=657 RepID=UPI001C463393|nr:MULTISPECIES: GNAT family N-acetyltransferase [Photobacterium]MBV7262396.1 GNAT family N-acetyltransferase [Photobacterium sp. WH24]MCG2836288.1 GNAT family N-acetyltransferase [Photobacterium sp. WH77]MCG2844085.1 GNAT family N-acetyltransferase [Photobacterium sp. WH80]MDO6580511.1 GNAT family N-acetyltransferase [Photobacterium sp. 2_MG-2023]
MLELTTQRCVLRPLTLSDAGALFDIFSDPDVMRYWDSSPWQSIEEANDYIQASKPSLDEPEKLVLGIYEQPEQRLLGKCMLFNIDQDSRRAELGFGISKAHWGRGLVQEVASALIQFAFQEMQLNRLEVEIDPDNTGSAKVLTKLGFSQEGYLAERWIVDGKMSDSAIYGLLARKWRA